MKIEGSSPRGIATYVFYVGQEGEVVFVLYGEY